MSDPDRRLAAAFRDAVHLAREQREAGATPEECRRAMETILRANWPTPPLEEWPWWARVPRCGRCDGYGLVITTVRNRLGCVVEVGTPCTCQKGARYEHRAAAPADFTAAGTVAPKPAKGFTKW